MQVQVSGKRFSFPPYCVCCGVAAETEIAASASRTTGKRVVRTKTNTWMFPYCRACVAHVAAWDAAGGCALMVLVLLFALMLAIAVHPLLGLAIAAVGVWYATHASNEKKREARHMCSPQCTSAQRAVNYIGWSGTVETFDIASERYAVSFMLSNRSKLVNVSPETWSKLAQAQAIVASPSPASSPTPTSPPPPTKRAGDDALLRWVQKVEGTKGPAARRAAIELALKDKDLLDGHRAEFIKSAAQIEVRATLDKVDGLKTQAAKRRHLEDALRALRSDSAPDELQAAEIRCLEDAVREVSGQ